MENLSNVVNDNEYFEFLENIKKILFQLEEKY